MSEQMQRESDQQAGLPAPETKQKLPVSAHVLCGWPLLLIAIGGAIGGGLGGAAYGINISIYKSKLPGIAKAILNLIVGLAAIGIWIAIAAAIQAGRK